MLNRTNKQPMPSQFVLTKEQRHSLIQGKVERAEAQVKAIASIASKLRKS